MIRYSSPSTLMSLLEYLPNRMWSPTLTSTGTSVPSSRRLPCPTAMTSASCGFSLAESGIMMPLRSGFLLLDPLHHNAIGEGSNFHHAANLQLGFCETLPRPYWPGLFGTVDLAVIIRRT